MTTGLLEKNPYFEMKRKTAQPPQANLRTLKLVTPEEHTAAVKR